MEALSQVSEIADLNGDEKSKLMIEIVRERGESRRREIDAVVVTQVVGGVVVGLPAVILAVGKAIDMARPPTWWESITGKK